MVSRFTDNEVIKTFGSKPELVKYVKTVLSEQEQCKIVINSSKPKAVYFQCERSGSFRTTVKEAAKRQRVAYTKRNKCGYRLVANLYPPKDKKKLKRDIGADFNDSNVDVKLTNYQQQLQALGVPGNGVDLDSSSFEPDEEIWVLRMIHPAHNHPLEQPIAGGLKKKRSKYNRTLVEKPLTRNGNLNLGQAYNPNDMLETQQQLAAQQYHQHQQQQQQQYQYQQHQQQHPHHLQHDVTHGGPSAQDVAVLAAMTDASAVAAAAALEQTNQVDPNIDPNVDPSVQDHDHSHRLRYPPA